MTFVIFCVMNQDISQTGHMITTWQLNILVLTCVINWNIIWKCTWLIYKSTCDFVEGNIDMASNKVDMKTVLLGKEYSGKTCLVQRYLHERFNDPPNYQAVSINDNNCFICFIYINIILSLVIDLLHLFCIILNLQHSR